MPCFKISRNANRMIHYLCQSCHFQKWLNRKDCRLFFREQSNKFFSSIFRQRRSTLRCELSWIFYTNKEKKFFQLQIIFSFIFSSSKNKNHFLFCENNIKRHGHIAFGQKIIESGSMKLSRGSVRKFLGSRH